MLHAAREQQASGVLKIQAKGGTSRLYFREGRPAGAQGVVGYRPLGQVLVQLGLVDIDTLDRALPAAQKGKPIGAVLLEQGAITREKLTRALETQQLGHLRALAALPDGPFEFEELEKLPAWTDEISLDPERALLDAMAARPAQALVDGLLTELGANLVRLTASYEALLPRLALDEKERDALELLRAPAAPEDLVATGKLAEAKARTLTATLLLLQAVEPVDPLAAAEEQAAKDAQRIRTEALERAESDAQRLELDGRSRAGEAARRQTELQRQLEEERRKRLELERSRQEEEAAAAAAEAERLQAAREAAEAAAERRRQATEEARRAAEELRARAEEEARQLAESVRSEAAARAERLAEEERLKADALARELEAEARRTAAEQQEKLAAEEALRLAAQEQERAAEELRLAAERQREEEERLAREAAEQLARDEAARLAREEAHRAEEARARAHQLALELSERLAREESARLAKEAALRDATHALAAELAERFASDESERATAEAEARQAREAAKALALEVAHRLAEDEAARVAAEEAAREAADALALELSYQLAQDESARVAAERAEREAAREAAHALAVEIGEAHAQLESARVDAERAAREAAREAAHALALEIAEAHALAESARVAAERAAREAAREAAHALALDLAAAFAREESERVDEELSALLEREEAARAAADALALEVAEAHALAESARVDDELSALLEREEAARAAAEALALEAAEAQAQAEAARVAAELAAREAARVAADALALEVAEAHALAEAARIDDELSALLEREEAERAATETLAGELSEQFARAEADRSEGEHAVRRIREAALLAVQLAHELADEEALRSAAEAASAQARAESERVAAETAALSLAETFAREEAARLEAEAARRIAEEVAEQRRIAFEQLAIEQAVLAAAGEAELAALEASGGFGEELETFGTPFEEAEAAPEPVEPAAEADADPIAAAMARAEQARQSRLDEARRRAVALAVELPLLAPEPLTVTARPSAIPELEIDEVAEDVPLETPELEIDEVAEPASLAPPELEIDDVAEPLALVPPEVELEDVVEPLALAQPALEPDGEPLLPPEAAALLEQAAEEPAPQLLQVEPFDADFDLGEDAAAIGAAPIQLEAPAVLELPLDAIVEVAAPEPTLDALASEIVAEQSATASVPEPIEEFVAASTPITSEADAWDATQPYEPPGVSDAEAFVATSPASFDPLPLIASPEEPAPPTLSELRFEPPPDVLQFDSGEPAPLEEPPPAPEATEYLDSLDSLTASIQMPDVLAIEDLYRQAPAPAEALPFEMEEPTGPRNVPAASPAVPQTPPTLEPSSSFLLTPAEELPQAPLLLSTTAEVATEAAGEDDFASSFSSLSGEAAEPEEDSLFAPPAPKREALADSEESTPTDPGLARTGHVASALESPSAMSAEGLLSRGVQPLRLNTVATAGTTEPPPEPVEVYSESAASDLDPMDLLEGAELSDEEAKARRQRLLLRAFKNMGVVARGAPGAPQRESSAQPPAAAPVAQGSPDVAELELAKRIEEKAQTFAREDHFARLGVSRAASKEQIKAAFFGMAKIFHPDRLPATLLHLQPKVKDIFSAIRESYDLLQDDERRRQYLQQLAAAMQTQKAPVRKTAEELPVLLKQGELAMKKKEYGNAATAFARAFAISGEADHLAQQAWAIFLDPTKKTEVPKVKALLAEALKKNRQCDRALYSLGVIARIEGEITVAERHFRAALEANPKHAEAASELRLIERRKGKKGGGLFS